MMLNSQSTSFQWVNFILHRKPGICDNLLCHYAFAQQKYYKCEGVFLWRTLSQLCTEESKDKAITSFQGHFEATASFQGHFEATASFQGHFEATTSFQGHFEATTSFQGHFEATFSFQGHFEATTSFQGHFEATTSFQGHFEATTSFQGHFAWIPLVIPFFAFGKQYHI